MKNLLIVSMLCCAIGVSAQSPQAIPYQAVARDNAGNIIANQNVSLRFSIHDVTPAGTIVYSETQSAVTNALGLFIVNVGQGTPVTGTFAAINWGSGNKFMQVEMDATGGTSYIDMGTQQMLSVPYALYAEKSNVPPGTSTGSTLHWNGTSWIADTALTNNGSSIGIGTGSPNSSAALEISSTSKGFLLPRLTTVQREAIPNPPVGLMIYNTDSNCIDLRTPSSWLSFCDGTCYPQPTTATAGPDQQNVSNPVTLQGNVPVYGNGTWTIISGSGGSFANASLATTQFTGTSGLYTLRWTIATSCDSTYDEVFILYPCAANSGNCNSLAADGCETNLLTSTSSCGFCGNNCNTAFPNASGACTAGSCVMGPCNPGFYDLDGSSATGCEYACTFISSTDNPDASFVDANCDGIDGNVTAAIFVATSGSNANPGTKSSPKLTISAAITAAVSGGKTQVYISQGVYNERVTLSNGISLYGGYSASNGWARSLAYTTTINSSVVSSGVVMAMQGINITSPTVVDQITISTGNTSSAGISNYGVHCTNCTGLTLSRNSITAGNAGSGTAGSPGGNGGSANSAAAGVIGSCDGDGAGAPGGNGGTSFCTRTGGAGGSGGSTTGFGSQNGAPGASGVGGATGGFPGSVGNPGNPGGNGNFGATGAAGNNGSGGSSGNVVSNFWVSGVGATGTTGADGGGGGGGGGGGSQSGFPANEGYGNGGGGGGAGGCAGTAGSPGTGGGGSFGLFLVSSTGIVLTSNTITSGNGGNGGPGANGGTGSAGSVGASGGTNCLSEIGRGGNGGNGGAGGNGGHGGGGAGGPSYSLFRQTTTVSTSGNTLIFSTGGTGGSSAGNAGTNGAAASIF